MFLINMYKQCFQLAFFHGKEFINFISQIVWDKPHQYLFINTDSQRLFKNFDEIIIDE